MTIEEILEQVNRLGPDLVEVTGGEPLAQTAAPDLCQALLDRGYRVLLETSGAVDITGVPSGVVIVMDIKTPGSGEAQRNRWENLNHLKPSDEVKFVVTSRADFDWAVQVIRERELHKRFEVLISPAWGYQDPTQLAEWVRDCGLPVRFQLPLHKVLWPHRERGV